MVNFGSSLSERRYLRTVFLDSPVRRDISLIEKWSRKCQRRMTLNNSMSITPSPPGHAKGVRFEHGSVLGGKTRAARVSSQWKSTLSYRDVEDLLAERGLDVSYETVRRWVLKFGPVFARGLRRRRPRPTSQWRLDEMAVLIGGKRFWLWRAVDDEGER